MLASTMSRFGGAAFALAVGLVTYLGTHSAVEAQGAPGPNVACLYGQPDFRGVAVCVTDEERRPRLTREGDNWASSFRIDQGWALRVCQERDFGGWCRTFVGDVANLNLSDNDISSWETLRLRTADARPPSPPQPPAQGVVCLYHDLNYRGQARCVSGPTSVAALPPWDDNVISSFRVNDGWRLTACRDPNFGGWCRDFDADEPVLRASNDAISSFRVTRLAPPPAPPPTPAPPPPQQRVACLYTQPNYGGLAVCASDAERVTSLGRRLNDNVGSVRLAAGWSIAVCTDADLNGFCGRLDEDTPSFGPRLSNAISSYQVFRTADFPPPPPSRPTVPRPRPQPAPGIVTPGPDGPTLNLPGIIGAIAGEVCLYEHFDFNGRRICNRAGTEERSMPAGMNDAISSVRVPQGLVLTVCEDVDFGGRCSRFDQDDRQIRGFFNDRISSYRITPNF